MKATKRTRLICRLAGWFRGTKASPRKRSQPIPTDVIVAHLKGMTGEEWTAISRGWAPGDAKDCRLCPRDKCVVSSGGVCLVVAPCRVEGRDCPLWAFGSPKERGLN